MAVTLAGLKTELQRRAHRIKRAAHLLKIEIGPIRSVNGEECFDIRVWWKSGDATFHIPATLAKYRACWIMRQIVQDIFMQRNV